MKSNDGARAGRAAAVGPARRDGSSEPSPDLNKVRTFFVIAEAGGVSAAARRLALTRSAVSHSLALLEESLGVPLFHRVGKRLVLTRDGARLRAAFADAQSRLDDAFSAIGAAGGPDADDVRGTVRLGLFLGFSRHRIADVIARFVDAHPRARVRLAYASRAELAEQLAAGRLDFTLSLHGRAEARRPRMQAMHLYEQPLVLAVRRRPPGAARGFARIAALPLVDYFRAEPLIDRWAAHHFGRERVPRANVRVWAQSTDTALELCLRGVGACVLPLDLVAPHRRRGELVVVRGPGETLRDEIWLNELPGLRRDRLQDAFRDALRASARRGTP